MAGNDDLTAKLQNAIDGDEDARATAFQMMYEDIHDRASRLIRGEADDLSWGPTDLIGEGFLRLFKGSGRIRTKIANREYFFRVVVVTMKRLLVDHAREKKARKRGGDLRRMNFIDNELTAIEKTGVDICQLDEALEDLLTIDERGYAVVLLRTVGGLTEKETARALDLSESTVRSDYKSARAILKAKLGNL